MKILGFILVFGGILMLVILLLWLSYSAGPVLFTIFLAITCLFSGGIILSILDEMGKL